MNQSDSIRLAIKRGRSFHRINEASKETLTPTEQSIIVRDNRTHSGASLEEDIAVISDGENHQQEQLFEQEQQQTAEIIVENQVDDNETKDESQSLFFSSCAAKYTSLDKNEKNMPSPTHQNENNSMLKLKLIPQRGGRNKNVIRSSMKFGGSHVRGLIEAINEEPLESRCSIKKLKAKKDSQFIQKFVHQGGA